MKRLYAVVILFAFALSGCPDPNPATPKDKFAPGYNTVKYGKLVMQTAYTAFKGAVTIKRSECNDKVCAKLHPDKKSEAYKTCMGQDHSAVAEFKTCYGKLGQAEAIVDKAYPLVMSLFNDVKDILDLAVAYEIAKEAKKLKGDEAALKKFCDTVYPGMSGDEYQKCLKGEQLAKFDYEAAIKGRACTGYHAFDFIPAPYNKYTDPIRMLLRGYGGGCAQ